jgi:hypothetical protein
MWKIANRALVLGGPAVVAAYWAGLTFLATAAPSNAVATAYLAEQITMLAAILSTPSALVWVVLCLAAWAAAVFYTDHRANAETRARDARKALGKRAEDCAAGVVRLSAMHRLKDAMALQHRLELGEPHRVDFTSSASLLADYAMLFSATATAILREAVEAGIPLDRYAVERAAHPVNLLGVEDVGAVLGMVAERIKHE